MSPALHPHWHTTDNVNQEETSIPVHIHGENQTPQRRYAVRHPAAIVGILLVLGLGVVFIEGVQELRGQVGTAPITIRITPGGLNPKDITATPGQTIIWKNEQETPHILTSDTLPVDEGTLYTPHILPGSDFRTRIARSATPGSFTYVSLITEDIVGTITIEEPAPTSPPPVSRPAPVTSAIPSKALPSNPVESPRPLAPLASIPRNPYALDAPPVFPAALNTGVEPYETSPRPPLPPLATTTRPFAQPQTGPKGMAAAILIGMLAVAGMYVRLTKKINS